MVNALDDQDRRFLCGLRVRGRQSGMRVQHDYRTSETFQFPLHEARGGGEQGSVRTVEVQPLPPYVAAWHLRDPGSNAPARMRRNPRRECRRATRPSRAARAPKSGVFIAQVVEHEFADGAAAAEQHHDAGEGVEGQGAVAEAEVVERFRTDAEPLGKLGDRPMALACEAFKFRDEERRLAHRQGRKRPCILTGDDGVNDSGIEGSSNIESAHAGPSSRGTAHSRSRASRICGSASAEVMLTTGRFVLLRNQRYAICQPKDTPRIAAFYYTLSPLPCPTRCAPLSGHAPRKFEPDQRSVAQHDRLPQRSGSISPADPLSAMHIPSVPSPFQSL